MITDYIFLYIIEFYYCRKSWERNNSDPKSRFPNVNMINKLIKFYEPVGNHIVNNSDPTKSDMIEYSIGIFRICNFVQIGFRELILFQTIKNGM